MIRLAFTTIDTRLKRSWKNLKTQQALSGTRLKKLSDLPPILQQYLQRCGYADDVPPISIGLNWREAFLQFNPTGNWKKITCRQVNFLYRPARIALMRRQLLGFLTLEACDQYVSKKGRMTIQFAKIFQLSDAQGPEMDHSALVTMLAEVMLFPQLAFCPDIEWQIAGTRVLQATLTDEVLTVSGNFHFDDKGDIIKFSTNDRYFSGPDGKYLHMPWVAFANDYRWSGGYRIPGEFSAGWMRPEGLWLYFKGSFDTFFETTDYSHLQAFLLNKK